MLAQIGFLATCYTTLNRYCVAQIFCEMVQRLTMGRGSGGDILPQHSAKVFPRSNFFKFSYGLKEKLFIAKKHQKGAFYHKVAQFFGVDFRQSPPKFIFHEKAVPFWSMVMFEFFPPLTILVRFFRSLFFHENVD